MRAFLVKKSASGAPTLFQQQPVQFSEQAARTTKEGTLPGTEEQATPEEHVHNAVMQLAQTGEATAANIAQRTGMSHAQTIGLLSRLRMAGHVLRDGPQYRLGRPLPAGGLAVRPGAKPPKGQAPIRQSLRPGEVEEAVKALGFSHPAQARDALARLQQHGRAGLLQHAKQARERLATEYSRVGHHDTPVARQATTEMQQAGEALVAGRLHPSVQMSLFGQEPEP